MNALRTVVVDGVEIPEFLIAREAQHHPGGSAGEARAAAAHALAIKALLLNRAAELGLSPEPELDERGREETPEEALVRAVLEVEVEVRPPTDAECRRVHDAELERFRAPPLFEASHILFAPDDRGEAAIEAARRAAIDAIDRLLREPGAFAALAADRSDCPSAAIGGSLGQLSPGDLAPEVESALTALAEGGLSTEPVRSRFGWHILRLDRRIEGRPLPFEQVQGRIALHLESRAWMAAAARYVAGLAAEARSRGVALTITRDGDVAPGGVTLGDLIADNGAAARLMPWLTVTDPVLAGRVAAAAADAEVSDWIHRAVAAFVDTADDQAWTQLVSAAQGADDPALAAIAAILKSRLTPAKPTFTLIRRR